MAEELVLDTAIRDWVLIPLSVVMVLIGVLRYFVSKLMRSPAASPSPDPKLVREGYVLCSPFLPQFPSDLFPVRSIQRSRSGNDIRGLISRCVCVCGCVEDVEL
jgi:hypothetical protein